MNDLKTEQLEAIRRLLLDPLREAVRQEIRLSHQSLSASLTKLSDRFDLHAVDYQRRITRIEQSVAKIKLFRDRIVMIYGVMAVVLSVVWAIVRQRVMTWIGIR